MRGSHFLLGLAVLALVTAPAGAETIDFEDLPAANDSFQTLSEEYAHMGVHFSSADDGATWAGLSDGDPGGWQLDGTNGSTFMGFDGSSYTALVDFDAPVQEFELDVARGVGSFWRFNTVTVSGFRERRVVEAVAVFLGAVNDWQTISMTQEVDRVHIRGVGFPGYRFGIDNLRWAGDGATLIPVDIDIKPDSDDNPIQLKSRGVVPVVLYGAEDFDVESVDATSLAFGPGQAGVAHRNGPHFDDVDGDGYLDMLVHHRVVSSEIAVDDFEACLSGQTSLGQMFEGCDLVTPLQ